MKAILLTHPGAENNLNLGQVALPLVQEGEALIHVSYCGVNHLDLLIQQGKRPGPINFPHVLGSEIVGKVEKISPPNNFQSEIHEGDMVAVYPWTFCGTCPSCLAGNENICDNGGTIGRTKWEGYAEFVTVPIKNLVKIPSGLPLEQVCTVTLAGTTAVHLVEKVKITDGSSVLITGGTGGVGTLVLQLLKRKHCQVIVVTTHQKKSKFLKTLGVNHIVSSTAIKKEVRAIFPMGVNYVIDIVGGKLWSECLEVLAKNGSQVFCATSLTDLGTVNIGSAFARQIQIIGSYGGTRSNLRSAIDLLSNQEIQPTIDTIYPLEKADQALARIDQQTVSGKLLLQVQIN